MKKDSINEDNIEEIQKLKEEINEKLNILNEKTSSESMDKVKGYNEKIKNNYKDIDIDEISQMNKKEKKKAVKKLNFYNNYFDFLNRHLVALQTKINIDPGRLMGLTDGIFSIVMTLLIFGMALPEMELLTASDFSAFIISMLPKIGITILSFILLASFWIYHHEFIKVNSLNMPFLWLNIVFLASISFIPFTTTLIATYSQFLLANLLFGLNILLSIILFTLMFKYADKRDFLENELTVDERKYTYHTFYMIMGITVIVTILAFYVSDIFVYLFLIIPIISIIRESRFVLKHVSLNE